MANKVNMIRATRALLLASLPAYMAGVVSAAQRGAIGSGEACALAVWL